eukprot:s1549_g9.t2
MMFHVVVSELLKQGRSPAACVKDTRIDHANLGLGQFGCLFWGPAASLWRGHGYHSCCLLFLFLLTDISVGKGFEPITWEPSKLFNAYSKCG